ncbi:hypothetical protein [Bradyrhizobium sp. URHD0069]|uniref:hypothetical protein n=1 Tax=Bradyrhizobium sp. URHD0069 TaxID=1380355 RepID=UPI00049845C0|nr:hypothetical protein [Bradyrhizobium sp. URHD0069]
MNEEELVAQSGCAPTMYFDGFGYFRKINGVLRCVGFVFGSGAQLNLVISLAGADQAQIDTQRALREDATTKGIQIWSGCEMAH